MFFLLFFLMQKPLLNSLRRWRATTSTVGGLFVVIGRCLDTFKIDSFPVSGSFRCAQKLLVTGATMAFVVSFR